jgi:hypothetical protein
MLILSQRDGAMSDALGLPLPDEIFGGVSPAEYAFMPPLAVLVSQRLATPLNAHIQRGPAA